MSFFPNSGAEAVEGAVKLAYRYHGGQRRQILHADISFHGRLLGSGSLTGAGGQQSRFPGLSDVGSFRYGDLDSVREAVAGARAADGRCDVYAILIEPVSASSMEMCSSEFLRGLRELCSEQDIVLVFDEIYTGWGKTGSLFSFMRHEGLVPDILTTSKSFGGGKSSISAFIARERVFRRRRLEAVLAPGLERLRKQFPDIITGVCGAGALHGIWLEGGPAILDLAARLAPGGFARDPHFRTKLIISSVVDALYRDHDIYAYYGLNGRNPLIAAPPLVAEPEHAELFLEGLEATLGRGLPRLLTRFAAEKVTSRWPFG